MYIQYFSSKTKTPKYLIVAQWRIKFLRVVSAPLRNCHPIEPSEWISSLKWIGLPTPSKKWHEMTWALFPQVQTPPVTSERWHHQVEQLTGVVLCCSNCMFLCSRLSLSLLFLLMSLSPLPPPSRSFLLPLRVCFPSSGVQMTIPVNAVKPPLWPVSTVCPFLLPVCLSICLLWSCTLATMCVHVRVCLFAHSKFLLVY